MKIKKRIESDIAVLIPDGRIDMGSLNEFSNAINYAIETEGMRKVLIDFSCTEYMSSAGIRALIEALKKLEAKKGKLAFCTPSDTLKELFSVVQLEKVIKIYNSEFEALDAMM
ncbi:MAG: STAS domain-containing protein [bacterium]|nr:STAS domain-containing protein [bacterium]